MWASTNFLGCISGGARGARPGSPRHLQGSNGVNLARERDTQPACPGPFVPPPGERTSPEVVPREALSLGVARTHTELTPEPEPPVLPGPRVRVAASQASCLRAERREVRSPGPPQIQAADKHRPPGPGRLVGDPPTEASQAELSRRVGHQQACGPPGSGDPRT